MLSCDECKYLSSPADESHSVYGAFGKFGRVYKVSGPEWRCDMSYRIRAMHLLFGAWALRKSLSKSLSTRCTPHVQELLVWTRGELYSVVSWLDISRKLTRRNDQTHAPCQRASKASPWPKQIR